MKYITLLLMVSLLMPTALPAQNSNTKWLVLQAIPSGQLVVVKTASGKSLKGQMQRVIDSALELSVSGNSVNLQSAEISRVYVLRGRQLAKGTLIGAAIGAAGGAGMGAIAGRGEDFILGQGSYAAIGAAVGLILGSITGLLVGSFRHKKELVYEAAPTPAG